MQALKMHGGFKPFYPDDIPLLDKVHTTAQSVYGTDVIVAETRVRDRIDRFQNSSFRHFPACMAKTTYSLSADLTLKSAPAQSRLDSTGSGTRVGHRRR